MAYKNFKKTEIIDELGIELRKARNAKELTLAQVADALEKKGTHVSGIMLGRIETGQRRIDDDLFHALCDYYHVDPDIITVHACQAHIATVEKESNTISANEDESLWIAEVYRNLPQNRQADIRTMMRIFTYMDKFSKFDD